MYSKICSVCKNRFYGKSRNLEGDLFFHDDCKRNKKSKHKKQRPVRTSTPVAELEYSPVSSFSDSVTDFFYQSWKSGLHSDDSTSVISSNQINHQRYAMFQPAVCYAPQVVYVSTVIFQPLTPMSCVQPVGYRPDGTFGLLPIYW